MADIEKNGDEELRERLREAYGYSDTQLEKRLEEAECSLGDTEFPGAGERMFQKLMERKEAEESAAGTAPEPKPVRFRKKKAIMAVALAAAIALMLGSTAIGGKHYFFKEFHHRAPSIIIDNDENNMEVSNLEKAYTEISQKLQIRPMRLGYVPPKMKYKSFEVDGSKAKIYFTNDGQECYFIQTKKEKGTSIGIESDKKIEKSIFNKWLNSTIIYYENHLEEEKTEYEFQYVYEDCVYCISGIFAEDEWLKLLKNLYFF